MRDQGDAVIDSLRTAPKLLLAVPVVAAIVLGFAIWAAAPHVETYDYVASFEDSGQELVGDVCVHWTVSGELVGEASGYDDGSQWAAGFSDTGEVDADVVSPKLALEFTDGCGGAPVVIDAADARWGFEPSCSAADALGAEVPATESMPTCALELSFGFEDGAAVTDGPQATSSFTAANTDQVVELDDVLPIGDSGFVCLDAVAALTLYDGDTSESATLSMETCAI